MITLALILFVAGDIVAGCIIAIVAGANVRSPTGNVTRPDYLGSSWSIIAILFLLFVSFCFIILFYHHALVSMIFACMHIYKYWMSLTVWLYQYFQYHFLSFLRIKPISLKTNLMQGRIQDFKIEGAQKMSNAHQERKTRNPFNSGGFHRARLKTLEALWFYMLSHAIWGLFWSILIQNGKKTPSRSKIKGGARLLHPPLEPPLFMCYLWFQIDLDIIETRFTISKD